MLSKADSKGISSQAHLQQVAKVTGKVPEALALPVFPGRMAPVWAAFAEIHSARTYGMNGPNPLTWSDIKAWNDLMDHDLKPWEVRAIKALDTAWMDMFAKGSDK